MNVIHSAVKGLGKINKMVNNVDKSITGIYGGNPTAILDEAKMYTGFGGFKQMYNGAKEMTVTDQNIDFLKKALGDDKLAVGGTAKLGAMDRLTMLSRNGDGSMNYARAGTTIAGSYVGVSAVGRLATGGGVYKDGSGNTDLIGVPLV